MKENIEILTLEERLWLIKQAESMETMKFYKEDWMMLIEQINRYHKVKDELNITIATEDYEYPDRYNIGYLDGLKRAVGLLEALEADEQ